MVEMTAIYKGQKHCEVQHGPSRAIVETDAPKDNHGKGEAFSPTDLFSASLGVCMLTVMGIQADLKGWDITHSTAKVTKEMSQSPRRIKKLTVHLNMPSTLSTDAKSQLEQTALNCPVKLSLHPEIELDIRFTYNV